MVFNQVAEITDNQNQVMTVTEFSSFLKKNLEDLSPHAYISGELSGVFRAQSGHIYCQIKDKTSQIKLVIFKGVASKLLFDLTEGMQVVLSAQVSMYQPRGELQLIAKKIEPEGIGALKLAYDQLKSKLRLEGIFDIERKKEVRPGSAIGLITSKDGAVLHDMIKVIRRRNPLAHIVHYVTPVQGREATFKLVEALRYAGEQHKCDVYIIARGGGSLEDLWNFNEEAVIRAIADFPWPIISAIGHETDVSLSDFTADLRAPTPSIAAELATTDYSNLDDFFEKVGLNLTRTLMLNMRRKEQDLDYYSQQMSKVFKIITLQVEQVIHSFLKSRNLINDRVVSNNNLLESMKKILSPRALNEKFISCSLLVNNWAEVNRRCLIKKNQHYFNILETLFYKMKYSCPDNADLQLLEEKIKSVKVRLNGQMISRYTYFLHKMDFISERLENNSYQKALQRGFSMVTDKKGFGISSIHDIKTDTAYSLNLKDGVAEIKRYFSE